MKFGEEIIKCASLRTTRTLDVTRKWDLTDSFLKRSHGLFGQFVSVTAAIDQYFDASDRWHSHHHWLHHLIDPRATWCDIRCGIVHDFQP